MPGRIIKISDQGQVRFYEAVANGAHKINLQAPASLAADLTFTLPNVIGAASSFLQNDGAGGLSWGTGTSTLQAAYDAGKTITLVATAIALTQANNVSVLTINKTGAGAGNAFQIDNAGTDNALRVNNTGAGTAVGVVQTGNATAMTISNSTSNACLSLTANGTSAALQINQVNLLDSITTNGDIRQQQAIWTLHAVGYNNTAIQFGEAGHTPSGPFYDAILFDASDDLYIGNAARDWPLNLRTGAASPINLITNGSTRYSLASTGLLSSTQASNNGMLSLTKSATGVGVVLALSNAGVGVGLDLTQTGIEDAMRITHTGAGAVSGLQISHSSSTGRCLKLMKTGTGANPCLDLANAGTGFGILITQTGDAIALQVSPSSASVNAAISITHGNNGDVVDILGTSATWKITSKGNFRAQRLSSTRSSKTIAAGAIPVGSGGWIALSGEGGVADSLDTITSDATDPVTDGQIIWLKAASDTVDITVTEAGNISLDGGSKLLDSLDDVLALIYDSVQAKWLQFAFASNG